MSFKRPIRIAGASGSTSDRRHAFRTFAANHPKDPVDVIIGDWMSEANMTVLAGKALDNQTQAAASAAAAAPLAGPPAYEPTFLEALAPALRDLERYDIKVAVNAGGSDVRGLVAQVKGLCQRLGVRRNVAWIEGDDVLAAVVSKMGPAGGGEDFVNICTGEKLRDWGFEPIAAQAYLGGMGIARALEEGADIVLCGRVSDASPVIGAAAWWHGWSHGGDDAHLAKLANAFVAGHLIECSNYVCGGNWTGFKELESGGRWHDIGYPIGEIGANGDVVITKQKGTGGVVNVDTCKAQLLYEIQGPWYYNSDVTAVLDDISFHQLEPNRVALRGVRAGPPPPTTKVGITARGGFQAEIHWFLVGLDIEAKARMLEAQIRAALAPVLERYHVLEFTLNGAARPDSDNQNEATVDFRVFAQARTAADLAPDSFLRPMMDLIMCAYPGATFHLDIRQGLPKPCFEYFVTLLPQADIEHTVHTHTGEVIAISPPASTKVWERSQPSQAVSTSGRRLQDFGETVRGPLGWLVHARSGDKGSNANVGFWVRHKDEWEWLRVLLSTERMKELLAKEYNGKQIDRFELPNMWAVHFLLHDHLDRGVSCSSSYDFLAKNSAEFLRSRYVDLPTRFLNRGKL